MRDEKIISRFGGQQIVDLYNLQNLPILLQITYWNCKNSYTIALD